LKILSATSFSVAYFAAYSFVISLKNCGEAVEEGEIEYLPNHDGRTSHSNSSAMDCQIAQTGGGHTTDKYR
jgi:hypothetical protein